MTEGRTGMTEGPELAPFRHARRVQSPFLSFPTFFIGNPESSPPETRRRSVTEDTRGNQNE